MQRVVTACRKPAVHLDEVGDARDLRRDENAVVWKTDLLGELRGPERARDHGVDINLMRVARLRRARVLVHHLCQQILIERSPVHADAHRFPIIDGDLDDRSKVLITSLAADVPWIDAVLGESARAVRVFREQQVAVVVEVANDRDVAPIVGSPSNDLGYRRRRLVVIDGHAYELRAGAGQRDHLRRRVRGVGGIRVRHRLHDDRIGATDGNVTNPGCGGLPSGTKGHDARGVDDRVKAYKKDTRVAHWRLALRLRCPSASPSGSFAVARARNHLFQGLQRDGY